MIAAGSGMVLPKAVQKRAGFGIVFYRQSLYIDQRR
jgi:hypothetical protein